LDLLETCALQVWSAEGLPKEVRQIRRTCDRIKETQIENIPEPPMTQPLANRFNCPTEFALTVLGGKWKTIIIAYLSERPCHYGELRQLLPGLSDKVLTERLKDLQQSGLVTRAKHSISKSPYVLTARGATLRPILTDLYLWGSKHADSFGVHVGNPLQKLDGSACGP
jgi:DNA-binding HxlR family transcriptional regulator